MADITSAFIDGAISSKESAQKLAAPARSAFEKDGDLAKVENELDSLWSAVLTAAEETPHEQQDRLVEIVRAIKEMPQPVHESKKLEIWGEEQSWDQLPLFGAKARERLDTAREKSGAAFINLNAFFARITAADINDFSLFAVWILREALEDPEEDEIVKTTSPELLQSASIWLVYASAPLEKLSREQKQFDGKMAKPGKSLSMFNGTPGWRGFCQDRWNTWLDRLVSLKKTEITTEAQSLISQVLGKASKV
ncbi:hypothetical protein G7Z17_g3557 [Cylindrodendrum hubeiense]|uniref:Uncharacterized protein n=1 Tax=Cylindrodendrum hubeiense TaxID=595255 RepID=A0A9P5HGM6_9HYPO|nr:hypothetical protein G7Z17_g3557 [Cylindrodendrum hubeiense]